MALSLLVHALILLVRHAPDELSAAGGRSGAQAPLSVTLAAPPAAAAPAAPLPVAPPAPRPAPRQRAPRAVAPPVIALPSPAAPTVPEPGRSEPEPVPPQPQAPPPMDMLAQLDVVRRRRREAQGESPEDARPGTPTEAQQAMRNIQRNLQSLLPNGSDASGTNGVFQITHVGYGSAEFSFRGWNTDFRRNWNETVTVERGTSGDIRLAIVRKMIEIIRRYETRDFVWESRRLGRNVTLSARPEDSAGLEEFLLREFFPEYFRAALQGRD